MLNYLIRRCLLLIPTLFGITFVVFAVVAFSPGGFGDVEKDAQGGMGMTENARKMRRIKARENGADLSVSTRYLRWLNQVSPVSFALSDQLNWSEEDLAEMDAILASLACAENARALENAHDFTLRYAGYARLSLEEAAKDVVRSLETPGNGESLAWYTPEGLDLLELPEADWQNPIQVVQERPKMLNDGDTQTLVKLQERLLAAKDVGAAQAILLSDLSYESRGRNRVVFSQLSLGINLGESKEKRKVVDLIKERLPVTLMLNLIAIPIIYAIALFTGMYSGRHKGTWFDWSSNFIMVFLWSLPVMWAGMLLIRYFARDDAMFSWFSASGLHSLNADNMAYLPRIVGGKIEIGYVLDMVWRMVLPILCMVYGGLAVMSKVMRGAIIDAMDADYVRTARAKGLSESVVLWRHAFRNSLLPLITMASSIIPALFAGTVVIETIFGINGMGKLSFDAANSKDQFVLMAVVLVGGLLKLASELIRDICYAIADPRVSYE